MQRIDLVEGPVVQVIRVISEEYNEVGEKKGNYIVEIIDPYESEWKLGDVAELELDDSSLFWKLY